MTRFSRLALLFTLTLISLAALLAGCGSRLIYPDEIPTQIGEDIGAASEALRLTENAPPTPYHLSIRVPQIDLRADELSGWRAKVYLQFEGVYSGTSRETRAVTDAEIQYGLLGSQRRVVLTVEGDLLEQDEPLTTEGVRLGPDTFFVRDNTCTLTTDSDASAIADLSAAALIGGVNEGVPDGTKAVINGEQVWRYLFDFDDLNLTNVQIVEGGRVFDSVGELWFSPARKAVIRFYLTLNVENATVFGSQVPVTGEVVMRYDVNEIGVEQNINVPYGC